jgi:hypothetical protein
VKRHQVRGTAAALGPFIEDLVGVEHVANVASETEANIETGSENETLRMRNSGCGLACKTWLALVSSKSALGGSVGHCKAVACSPIAFILAGSPSVVFSGTLKTCPGQMRSGSLICLALAK